MTHSRRLVLVLFGALALAGLYDAVHNLPVLTGCAFYAECGDDSVAAESIAASSTP